MVMVELIIIMKKLKVKDNFVVDIVHHNILKWRKDEYFGLKHNLRRTFVSFKKYLCRITHKH